MPVDKLKMWANSWKMWVWEI